MYIWNYARKKKRGSRARYSKIYWSVGGVGLSPSHSMLLAVWGSGRGEQKETTIFGFRERFSHLLSHSFLKWESRVGLPMLLWEGGQRTFFPGWWSAGLIPAAAVHGNQVRCLRSASSSRGTINSLKYSFVSKNDEFCHRLTGKLSQAPCEALKFQMFECFSGPNFKSHFWTPLVYWVFFTPCSSHRVETQGYIKKGC